MEFKKCLRCGCFFMSEDNVCCNCSSKDHTDLQTVNNFISQDNSSFYSIEELSANTRSKYKRFT